MVIAIIAILAAMLLPALSAARERARSASCISKLNNLGKAIIMYGDPNKGYIPAFDSVADDETSTTDVIYDLSDDTATPGNKILLGGYMGMNLTEVKKDNAEKTFKCPSDSANFAETTGYASYVYAFISEDAKTKAAGCRRVIIGRDNPGAALMYDMHEKLATGPKGSAKGSKNNHPTAINVLYFGGHNGSVNTNQDVDFGILDQITYSN